MKTTTRSLFAAALLALFSTLSACGSKDGAQPAAAAAAPPPTEVDVVTVTPGTVVLTQDLPGRLEAFRSAQVRARVEGIVEKRIFAEGSDVETGQSLYRIHATNYRAGFDAAKADLAAAQQSLDSSKKLLDTNFISPQAYDLAVAKFKQSEAAYARASEDNNNTNVPAPISGRIGRALVTEGALVGRGEPTLLATIEQIDPIYANFTQSGADVLRLQQSFQSGKLKRSGTSKVELLLDDGSVYALPGKLMFTNLAVDSSTGSVSLRAEFPNPKHILLPGMFARIRFAIASSEDSIKVPQRAVQMSTQGQSVMVVDAESKVAPRPIVVGGMTGGDFVIESGLKAGDQVIVNGLQKIRPGAPVKAVEWNPAGNSAPASAVVAAPEKK